MAGQVTTAGRLIAVDGSRGKDADAGAAALAEALSARGLACAISRFDASGLFGELAAAGRGDRAISVRTLTLVYAADLAFRLRWEIRPVLESGGIVVAAPYVDTAIAFGAACGLDEKWIAELLRFAPPPHARGRALERKSGKAWKARTDRGYAEFCAAMLEAGSPNLITRAARREAIAWLERRRSGRVFSLNAKGLDGLAKAVSDSTTAAPSRPRARARNARR
jgi:hypothetical protein